MQENVSEPDVCSVHKTPALAYASFEAGAGETITTETVLTDERDTVCVLFSQPATVRVTVGVVYGFFHPPMVKTFFLYFSSASALEVVDF